MTAAAVAVTSQPTLAELVAEERTSQGLPATVTDAATLGRVASLVAAAGSGGRDATAART